MPLDHVTLIESNLASVLVESLAYGVFLVLSFSSLYLVAIRHRRTGAPGSILFTPNFIGALLLLLSVSGHWMLTATRLFKAFVYFKDGTAPIHFYADLTDTTEVVKTAFLMAALVIGDALIIYRLWVVWAYNKFIIIFPILSLLGLCVSGVGITYQFAVFKPGQNVFVSDAGRWITTDAAFTLSTNVYSTVAIAYRMWSVNKAAGRLSAGNGVMSALAIFVESAAIYTAWSIFFICAYQTQSLLQFVAVDVLPHMSGIAFMLINVRVGLGWAQTAGITHQESKSFTTSNNMNGMNGTYQAYPRQLAVNVSQHTMEYDDYNYEMARKGYGGQAV